MRRLRLRFPSEQVTSIAELLETQAPRTCQAIWEALPFEGELIHAMWSGPETYLPIDSTLRIEAEHQTTHPLPGEIGFYAIDGGVLVDWPDDMAELAFFYGRGSRPAMPDGPVAMNIFARIIENFEGFQKTCARIQREGVKRLRVEREA
ncbi:MAG TPA: DUF3830 family protein [Vicinamibacteria bacterium]|nr:DUF3830 family protein [Vicinamibacteria bacterium]